MIQRLVFRRLVSLNPFGPKPGPSLAGVGGGGWPNRLRLGCMLGLGLLLGGCATRIGQPVVRSFDIVQLCDPQLGFTDYAADLARFKQAIKQVNSLHPDLVVICGDLVNGANRQSFADFMAANARFRIPCYLAPGNHDVGNQPSLESLERYRRLVGRDYYSIEHKGCVFVIVDSQLWKTPMEGETEQQDAWLARTLENAARRRRRIFVVMHHPLYVKEPDEPETYYNLPPARRRALLTLFEQSGVVAVLAGHTHTTTVHEYHGIQMITSENTSRNFDHQPYGFRVWHIRPERPYHTEFVPLTPQ